MSRVFLVVGTGRSGTSTTARILHEHFGIFMGEKFDSPNKVCPEGPWEDLEFMDLNGRLMNGECKLDSWMRQLEELINKRNAYHEKWGMKDPRIGYLLGLYLAVIRSPIIIHASRRPDLVIESLTKAFGFDKEWAKELYITRAKRIENLLLYHRYITINYDIFKTDEEIINELSIKMNAL